MQDRYIRFAHDTGAAVGRIVGDRVEALAFASMRDVLSAGFECGVKYTMPLSRARLLAPVKPSKIVCLGFNYAEHVRELKNKMPDEPMIFFKPSSAIIGPNEPITLPDPKLSTEVNNEVELAVVIAKECKNVSASDALSYVGGYTILLDITARDIQWRLREKKMQWEIAKSFDSFAPLGPWIVPAKEIDDPHNLRISLKVNGKIRQDASTSDMIFSIPEVIEYVSNVMTLLPGDIISTGTPPGVDLIQEGDKLEAEIEKIGVLKNNVAQS